MMKWNRWEAFDPAKMQRSRCGGPPGPLPPWKNRSTSKTRRKAAQAKSANCRRVPITLPHVSILDKEAN
jgi:hypothetical protein